MAFSSTAAAAAKKGFGSGLSILVICLMLSTCRVSARPHHVDLKLPEDIPANLNNFTCGEGDSNKFLVGVFLGVGVQEYTFNGSAWVNTNVNATLFDSNSKKRAHHFFIPQPGVKGGVATWAYIHPPSRVTAAKKVNIAQENAVPLLLLDATFNAGYRTTSVGFGAVTHVQRLQTRAGLPPNSTDAAVGQFYQSPYSAVYAFYSVP